MVKLQGTIPLLIVFMAALCCGCDGPQHYHFDSTDAVRQAGMIEKGWVPAFVPPDAKEIDFDGDLDTARVYGSYVSSDTASLHKNCQSADDTLRVPGYGPKWFSDDLKDAGTASKLKRKGYEVLHCGEGFNVVVAASRNYVSYWSIRG